MSQLTRRSAFAAGAAGWLAASVPGLASAAAKGPAAQGLLTTPANAVVPTSAGPVRGYREAGIYAFKGVPYGASTAGDGRFRPPQPPQPWTDVRLTLAYGDTCPQAPRRRRGQVIDWVSEEDYRYPSEDCLNLNVWSPALERGAKLPVLVWLHGGGFESGSSREHPAYDGANLARKGAVVVSINHRLGVLGFLDLSGAGERFEGSGNAGMLDIVLALQWVRDNVERFGGDPSRVTIFGQSGGGGKVGTLMGMPAAKGLFHRAVIMSGSFPAGASPADAQKLAGAVAQAAGGADAAALQRINVDALIAAGEAAGRGGPPGPRWGPVLDGRHLTQAWRDGAPAMSTQIPLMVGNCRDEFRDPNMRADEAALAGMAKRFGPQGADVLAGLKAQFPGAPAVEIAAALGGLPLRIMALEQAAKQAALGGAPVYSYWYVWPSPVLEGRVGVPHGADLVPFFDNVAREPALTGVHPDAVRLGGLMSKALLNFAATGRPDQPGLAWTPFNARTAPTMVFDTRSRMVDDPAGAARLIASRWRGAA